MMVEEEMSLQEAIQLTLALEESERYAKEEAANRSKLRVPVPFHLKYLIVARRTAHQADRSQGYHLQVYLTVLWRMYAQSEAPPSSSCWVDL